MDRAIELQQIYDMQMLTGEGTFYKEKERSVKIDKSGRPLFSTMLGLYSVEPKSYSKFHVLKSEEIWLFYEGDPFSLHLLYEDGSYKQIVMGSALKQGQLRQFVVPANVKQAACLLPGSKYALYGCIVVPAFTNEIFSLCSQAELLKQYPCHKELILALT